MPTEKFSAKQIERAHWWMAKAIDTLEEARLLVPSGQTRLGARNRLYYATHHTARALLELVGNHAKTHTAIANQFGLEWVKKRHFPEIYGRLLNSLHDDRDKADYGEYVPTFHNAVEHLTKQVENFTKRARREIPPVSTAKILTLLVEANSEIRDFSFDIYCPKSYFHHTRFTTWCPKGRLTDKWLRMLLNSTIRSLHTLRVKNSELYVIGLNSRVNQYEPKHILMLDLDDMSTLPREKFTNEPGFFFRTGSGYHFIGARLYDHLDWKKKMKSFLPLASKKHYELSMKRGYATLRLTASPRKPFAPVYIGRSS
ncbi:MAG: HEPN domain-containing protein [Chloroflexi bacterium]|nr:HEPN domain-containing protein [Chloroflexota bacterium]